MNGIIPAAVSGLLVLAIGSSAQAGGQVLLFETFDVAPVGWTAQYIDGAGGWRENAGNPGGAFVLNEGGNPSTDPTLSRVVTGLRIGQRYKVEGDFKDHHSYCQPDERIAFRVDVNGLSVFASTRVPDWTHFEYEWSASSTQVTIQFRAETDGTDCDAAIDNIRLSEVRPCLGDVTDNQMVDAVDLAAVLSAWGTSGQGQFNADINNDGIVDGADLAFVLSGWGPCP